MSCGDCKRRQAAKLGRCAFCISANVLGAAIGWLVFLAATVLHPHPAAARLSLAVASFFTLFSAAHGVAYLWRAAERRAPPRTPAG